MDIPEIEDPWWDPKKHVNHPIGRFLVQPVGSTSYCHGLHVSVHLHDEVKPPWGMFSFGAVLKEDGTVTWVQRQPNYVIKHERAGEIFEVAHHLAATWFERDPTHCVIHYKDMADKELQEWWRQIRWGKDSIKHLTKLLSDPEEPRTWNKKQDSEWGPVSVTAEERAERRALWERNLQRATQKLQGIHDKGDARIAQLEIIREKCRHWLRDPTTELFPFPAVNSWGR